MFFLNFADLHLEKTPRTSHFKEVGSSPGKGRSLKARSFARVKSGLKDDIAVSDQHASSDPQHLRARPK
jgi:hypothetical protein